MALGSCAPKASDSRCGGNSLDSYFGFDAAYLARLRARDQRTFYHFYEYFYIPIRNRVRRSVRNQDADDLVQEVFTAVIAEIDAGNRAYPKNFRATYSAFVAT